jgi:DNA polymerase III alpha subunit
MNSLIKFLTFSFIVLAIGCKKHEHNTNDQVKPILTIEEPMVNDTLILSVDPEVHIEFTATDNEGLHELNVLLIKNNTDTILNDNPSVHDLKSYAYHEHVVPTGITNIVSMKVIISAEDHGENKEVKTVDFFVTP